MPIFYYKDDTSFIGHERIAPHCKGEEGKILHREGRPAITYSDGREFWYIDGELHRLDGPAYRDSGNYNHYYVNGKRISYELFTLIRKSSKDDLITFLLSNKLEVRTLAEFRLKELENLENVK